MNVRNIAVTVLKYFFLVVFTAALLVLVYKVEEF